MFKILKSVSLIVAFYWVAFGVVLLVTTIQASDSGLKPGFAGWFAAGGALILAGIFFGNYAHADSVDQMMGRMRY